ncbi:MAG: transketolase [Clostridia bacterium]|nr:transketolase [Clostridia bacterium]
MNEQRKKELRKLSLQAKRQVIIGTNRAKSGHPGGSLSCADILTYLYFDKMNIDPKNPQMEGRDRLVLSKGHAAPGLYGVLAVRGFFPVEEIEKLRKPYAMLQGHPDKKGIPGVDMSAGSLGQGISAAAGMALSAKHFGEDYRVYAIIGDGESEEGQVWEAAMFAAHKKLNNLTVFVDLNHLQIDGTVEEVNSPLPLDKKFEAFNWNVVVIDGHDFDQIEAAVAAAEKCTDKPTAIIANTIKGKDVSFMENQVNWHGAGPNDEQAAEALAELDAKIAELG